MPRCRSWRSRICSRQNRPRSATAWPNTGQDLLADWKAIKELRAEIKGKGFKGAVGNAASYVMLFGEGGFDRFESTMSQKLELPFYSAATQTYTRKQDHECAECVGQPGGDTL